MGTVLERDKTNFEYRTFVQVQTNELHQEQRELRRVQLVVFKQESVDEKLGQGAVNIDATLQSIDEAKKIQCQIGSHVVRQLAKLVNELLDMGTSGFLHVRTPHSLHQQRDSSNNLHRSNVLFGKKLFRQ